MATSSEAQTAPLLPLQDLAGTSEELIKRLNESLKHYNNLCLFAPGNSPTVLAQRTDLSDKLDSIRSNLAEVTTAIERTTRDLQDAAVVEATRVSSLIGSIYWYEHGNLLDIPEEQMIKLIEDHPPKDAVHFAAYEADTDINENLHWGWKCEDDPAFAPKRVRLILALVSLPGGLVPGYQELVWARGNLLQKHRHLPTTLKQIETLGNAIDAIIALMFRRPSGRQHASTISFPLHVCGIGHLPLHFMPSDYYDTVRARRVFYGAWKQVDCQGEENYDDFTGWHGRTGLACWHDYNAHLMSELTWRTHAELEYNVRVAAQHILPQELLDEILDYSLMLEKVPFDPNIRNEDTDEYNWAYDLDHCEYWGYIR
ncbi:hypothetical protein LTR17_015179 [Elasticomyces elasticus]|nr:hypothetical protein LTR17_015179 [Elasticomyces elasticus]